MSSDKTTQPGLTDAVIVLVSLAIAVTLTVHFVWPSLTVDDHKTFWAFMAFIMGGALVIGILAVFVEIYIYFSRRRARVPKN